MTRMTRMPQMKILIADSFPETHQRALSDAGHSITVDPGLSGDSLKDAIGAHEILIVRSTKVDAAIIDAGTALQLVIRAGAGTNTIDKVHAAAKDIRVCNVPGANALAVAELVLGLIICLDRNLPNNVSDLHNKKWAKKKYARARGLYGQKLGILGLGAIGLAVAQRAVAFGMNVCIITKPGRTQDAQQRINHLGITQLESLDALLSGCDIVSLHVPATAENNQLVNDAFLAKMKDGAMLINTSRGDLLDEAAVLRAMESKDIRVAVDVYQNEPTQSQGAFESALANHPAVYGTHHIGASTEQAQIAVADGVLEVVQSFQHGDLKNCVN